MATREQRETLRTEVTELLTASVNLSPGDYARPELGKDLSFEDVIPEVSLMIEPLQALAGRDLNKLSFQQLERIKKAANIVNERLKEVADFNLAELQGAPMEARNQIVQRVHEAPDQVLELLSVPLALTSTQTADLAAAASEASRFRDQLKELTAEAEEELAKHRKDARSALDAIKTIAGEAGVAEHASYFEKARREHGEAAAKWLKATAVSGVVTLLAAIAFLILSFIWSPEDLPQSIQYAAAKLIVLSVTTFATVWCGSNYRAARHNELVNAHRRDALGTFRAFVEASDDAQVRDAILLQASQAAFSGRTTGFDAAEQPQPATVPFMESIRKLVREDSAAAAS